MASSAAIGIMRETAYARLAKVTKILLEDVGLTPSEYTGLSKDQDIAIVRTLEAIADDLEALTLAIVARRAAPEPEPVAVKGKK